MIIIGLTGSIGMGKSTVAGMFEQLGIPAHDADTEVHRLLSEDEEALTALRCVFPYFRYSKIYGKKQKSGVREIRRTELAEIVFKDEQAREMLEEILHPLVRKAQNDFIRRNKGRDMVVLDIPLLFETGAENFVDITVVATAPANIQQERVMQRPGMDLKKFSAILERQMPDGEKCARADYVIHTGLGRAQTMKEVKTFVSDLRKKA